MKYLDNLKKERSMDRVIFLAGMVLAFVGFLIPTVYVKQVESLEDLTAVEEEAEEEVAYEATSEEDDYEALMNYKEEEVEEVLGDTVIVLRSTKKDFVLGQNYDFVLDKHGNKKVEETVEYSYITELDLEEGQKPVTKYCNIFGITNVYNVSPTAYNATFLVAMWLCALAGIVLFFITKTIIGDIIAILVGLGFAVASVITIPLTFQVAPVVGYMTIGGYLVIIGWVAAIAGTVLGAAHIQHPSIKK